MSPPSAIVNVCMPFTYPAAAPVFGLPAPADDDAPCVPAEACALAVTATADAEASNSNLPLVNLS